MVLKTIALTGAPSPRSSSTGSPPRSAAGIGGAPIGDGNSLTTASSRAELPTPWLADDMVTGNSARFLIAFLSPSTNWS